MSAVRPASPGKTRTCPHCKAVILESASVCPGCFHHLRFGSDAAQKVEARNALQVEGRIKHPAEEGPWEYCVVVNVRNERNEQVARHVINVGALARDEERLVSLSVEVMPPQPVVPVQKPAPPPVAAARPPGQLPSPAGARPSAPQAPRPAPPSPPPQAGQPLPPAKTILAPPKPGDPYSGGFGRNKR